jgi:hypothetical protein
VRGLSLAPNQGIGHRGVNEAMSHATPLANQPEASPFVGAPRARRSGRSACATRAAPFGRRRRRRGRSRKRAVVLFAGSGFLVDGRVRVCQSSSSEAPRPRRVDPYQRPDCPEG